MKMTIISSDNTVYVDGVAKMELDLTTCGIPSDVHALQWFDVKGWIEFNDDGDPFTPRPPNEIIESLPQWALNCYDVWLVAPMPLG